MNAVEAPHGQRTVEVKVRFWTDSIAGESGSGLVYPKHVLAAGVVALLSNEAHGIRSSEGIPFNSLAELAVAVEDLFIAEGVTVVPSRKQRRYTADREVTGIA